MIEGITNQVEVDWLEVHGEDDNYIPNSGTFENNRQTAILDVKGAAVTKDKTFTCRVKSGQFPSSPSSDTDVQLDVYGKFKSWF